LEAAIEAVPVSADTREFHRLKNELDQNEEALGPQYHRLVGRIKERMQEAMAATKPARAKR
jgi:hypothetical protein